MNLVQPDPQIHIAPRVENLLSPDSDHASQPMVGVCEADGLMLR